VSGFLSLTLTVVASGASTEAMVWYSDLAGAVASLAESRSRVNFTSAESHGSPSWYFSPGRSLKTYSVPSDDAV
jgi:hypothetical protein